MEWTTPVMLLLAAVAAAVAEPLRQAAVRGNFPKTKQQLESYDHPYAGYSQHSGSSILSVRDLRALCHGHEGSVLVAHPVSCSRYVECWGGRAIEKRCLHNQLFSDLYGGFCDHREYVDCGHRSESEITTPPAQPQQQPDWREVSNILFVKQKLRQ